MLKFSKANAKTKKLKSMLEKGKKVYSLDLPAGWSCPGANICKSFAVVSPDGRARIKDGKDCQFRCYAASDEAQYRPVRAIRNHNFGELKKAKGWRQVRQLIIDSIPSDAGIVRYHVSGDFFKPAYLRGAIEAAKAMPDVLFYGYTKSLNLLSKVPMLNPEMGVVIDNFLLTASVGGRYDNLIDTIGIRTATVVFSESEANRLGLPIDHDDTHAATPGGNFTILLHGTQPKGSKAAKAWQHIKTTKGGYSRKMKK
jgi:hypothetical protein